MESSTKQKLDSFIQLLYPIRFRVRTKYFMPSSFLTRVSNHQFRLGQNVLLHHIKQLAVRRAGL